MCLAVLVAATATVLVAAMRGPTKDDIAWLLYVAASWLHGSRLYVDIVEVNPPLIVWICAVPALIGEWLKLDARMVAIPFFGAIILGCAAWASLIVSKARQGFGDPVIVFAVCGTVLMVIPNIEFGQREHLLIAAALPYLAVVGRELARDPPGRWLSIATAVVAALGCALKPRYVMAFGAVEIYCCFQGLRLLRPATVTAAATLASYVLAIIVLEPAFFREAIPMAFALYGASDVPFLDMLFDFRLLLVGLAVGAVMLATTPMRGDHSKLPAALFIFAVAATLVCFIQGKNWFYHRIPATVTAVLCLIAWASMRLRGEWRPGWRFLGPALLAGVALAGFGLHAYESLSHEISIAMRHQETTVARLAALIRREKAHSYVAFSDWIGLGFPVVNETGVIWASRFDSMWALDGEIWRAKKDGRAPDAFPIRRWVTADFRRACPDVVVVDRRSPLDYVTLLERADPAFLELWRSYVRIASFDGLVVFRHQPTARGRRPAATMADGCTAPDKLKG